MQTIFNINHWNSDGLEIKNAWILVSAVPIPPADSLIKRAGYIEVGKSRLFFEDFAYDFQRISDIVPPGYTVKERLSLVLSYGITDFARGIDYNCGGSEEYFPLRWNLKILSTNATFLKSVCMCIEAPDEQLGIFAPIVQAEYPVNVMRQCNKVSGVLLDKSEITSIGNSANPIHIINQGI